ncbi:MAG: IS1182 family transposase [Ktedonobacteraceae bacterium]
MMGFKGRAFAPLLAVSLEELVPQDHFYRHVQKVLDLSFVHDLVREYYSVAGRPSIDPVVFFKLHLVMFFEDIRSERLLMRQVADRLSVRWYLGYDLDEPLPDHSSLTKIRNRYGVAVFRRFFETVVKQCQEAGLVWGKELYIDSTKVQANASQASLKPRFFVEAHLSNLFDDPQSVCQESERVSTQEEESVGEGSESEERQEPQLLPISLTQQERETLTQSNQERHDWIEQLGAQNRRMTTRGYQRLADLWVSTTDPDATRMETKTGSDMGYRTHYVVDGGKSRIILQVLVAPSEVMDNQPMLDLLWRTRFRWKLWPRLATGDRKYGTEDNIVALETQHIRAFIPLPDHDHRTTFFSSDRFRYEPERDVYICPTGKELRFDRAHSTERALRYRARAKDCNHCPLKAQCTTNPQGRSLCRSVEETILERVRSYQDLESYKKALRKRQVWVEPLFAEGKDWHGMRRFRLRRLWRVNCEALIRAAGQNLKRLLKKRGWGRRPFPAEAGAMVPPPDWETDEFSRHNLLKNLRPGIAVASLVAYRATRTFFEPQTSWFSWLISIYANFVFSMFYFLYLLHHLVMYYSLSLSTFAQSSSSAFP